MTKAIEELNASATNVERFFETAYKYTNMKK